MEKVNKHSAYYVSHSAYYIYNHILSTSVSMGLPKITYEPKKCITNQRKSYLYSPSNLCTLCPKNSIKTASLFRKMQFKLRDKNVIPRFDLDPKGSDF